MNKKLKKTKILEQKIGDLNKKSFKKHLSFYEFIAPLCAYVCSLLLFVLTFGAI